MEVLTLNADVSGRWPSRWLAVYATWEVLEGFKF